MLIYAGIDEAGYGPMFGPLTVACATFVLPDHESVPGNHGGKAPDLWSKLSHAVARSVAGSKGRITITDSKKLKITAAGGRTSPDRERHPLKHLERGVLTFLSRMNGGVWPFDDQSLLRTLVPDGPEALLTQAPWYGGTSLTVPVGNDPRSLRIDGNTLAGAMKRSGVICDNLSCRALTESQFNEAVRQVRTKAAASFHLVGQHLAGVLARHGHHHPRIVIDRQGGRMHYREPLQMLFPEAMIRILDERDDLSRYELSFSSTHTMTLTFVEKAEDSHLPVALASMTAKYIRELLMIRFNRYFSGLRPELKPTAGYVEDGRRFLAEIEDLIDQQHLRRDQLVRCC